MRLGYSWQRSCMSLQSTEQIKVLHDVEILKKDHATGTGSGRWANSEPRRASRIRQPTATYPTSDPRLTCLTTVQYLTKVVLLFSSTMFD